MSEESVDRLLKRLMRAHKTIQSNILNDKIVKIPYRVGSRDYSPEEHLEVANKHLFEHLKEVLSSYRSYALNANLC